jgi:putative ABC transport system permease protein
VPGDGLVLTASLAKTLGIARGDTVSLELLERGGAERRVVVAALMEELVGVAGYMSRSALNRMVGEGATISGAWLALEPGAEAVVLDALRGLPRVAGASTRRATADSFREAIADTITVTTTLVALIAGVIAVGVLYNGARIALSERGRELASLRVLGFTRREVATLLLGEQAAVGVLGTPIGLGLGIGLAWLIAIGFDSELYRFPVIITPRTYLLAVGVVVSASLVAAVAMRRRIDALNMIEVLKTRE